MSIYQGTDEYLIRLYEPTAQTWRSRRDYLKMPVDLLRHDACPLAREYAERCAAILHDADGFCALSLWETYERDKMERAIGIWEFAAAQSRKVAA